MRLKLDIDGISFYLKITGYRKTSDSNWDEAWCNVEACLQNEYLNYYFGSEILLCSEIDTLEKYLSDLLNNKMTEETILECIEPDFEFICEPKTVENDYSGDILLFIVINLWEKGCLTANSIHLTLDRQDIQQLYTYLLYIKQVIDRTDERIMSLIKREILLPTYELQE